MAWYALYKWFSTFRKTPYVNMIQAYRKLLYDEWWNSLSEEQQKMWEKKWKEEKEQEKRDTYRSLMAMNMVMNTMCNMAHSPNRSYHGMNGLMEFVKNL